MVNGKNGQGYGSLRDLHIQTQGIVRQIPVGQHNALALSCGS